MEIRDSVMSKHIFVDDDIHNALKPSSTWHKLSHWEYIKKRIQFWKYRKHRTMGRPMLVRWQPTPTKQEEKE